jgi:hypothetical protein
VIQDADRCLARWLGAMLPAGTGIRFDPPDPAWARRPPELPFVDLFLYDITEDIDGLSTDAALVRDPDGHPVAWQPPIRRYRLSYLLTAWPADQPTYGPADVSAYGSADVPGDHELLGSVLAGCAATAVIPAESLCGALLEAGLPVQVRCAPPDRTPGSAGTAGLCQALRVPPRAALTLILIAPLRPAARTDVAPAARSLDLNTTATAPTTGPATGPATGPDRRAIGGPSQAPRAQRRWERTRITEQTR